MNFLFTLAFSKQLFAFQAFSTQPNFCELSPFLKYPPILKKFLHPSSYAWFWEVISDPNKGAKLWGLIKVSSILHCKKEFSLQR